MKDIWTRFFPNGRYVLNRAEWKGKEPRSCAVTRVSSQSKQVVDGKPMIVEIEVTYRPKGEINFVGKTRYDGWQAMVPSRTKSGEFADAEGKPLPDGASPIFLPKDVYDDVEYNDLDFGELVHEHEEGGIQRTTSEAVFEELKASGRIGGVAFLAARRSRPSRKLLVANAEADTGVDGFGTIVEVVPAATVQLKHVLSQKLTAIMSDFIEGRCTIKNIGNEQMTLAMLSDVLVDCTSPNGQSRFGVLAEFTEPNFMEDLAKHLMSAYELDVSIVPGEDGGLVLRHSSEKR
ncbi:hypothetical protein [Anatilimnocola floriformis]|uniref:hypothetical protein n=1 Tax=Anatilimnocola floriformis TaxID=2948575 RepID=UPI0020C49698|nr:hypothetical protein [Anatilimnocola floriformis]